MLKLEIPLACPSIQSKSVFTKLHEWRAYIVQRAIDQNIITSNFSIPEEGIRRIVKIAFDGPCKIETKFLFKKITTPDIDNMANFIASCFKMEESVESTKVADDIQKAGFVPWFYYTLFDYPYNMSIQSFKAEKRNAAKADSTQIIIRKLC